MRPEASWLLAVALVAALAGCAAAGPDELRVYNARAQHVDGQYRLTDGAGDEVANRTFSAPPGRPVSWELPDGNEPLSLHLTVGAEVLDVKLNRTAGQQYFSVTIGQQGLEFRAGHGD